MFRNFFLAAAVLGGAFWFGLADSAQAAPPAARSYRPPVIVNRPAPNHMPGWDWQRTYPWSAYNAWRNPYWYYPYTPYVAPPYYYGNVPAPSNYYPNYYDQPVPPVPAVPSVPPVPSLN